VSDNTFGGASRRLFFAIKRALSNRELRAIGKFAIDIIAKRTRNGFGVKQAGGPQTRLKKLSSTYIDYRKANRRKLDPTTTPGKSNLTFTGILLRSLRVVNVNEAQQTLAINANNVKRKGGVRNREIADFQAEQGRIFLNLSRSELLKIGQAYKKGLIENVNKDF